MRIILTFLCWFLMGQILFAQTINPIDNPWYYVENIKVVEYNKQRAHATFLSYKTAESSIRKDSSDLNYYQLLNGIWDFKWVKSPDQRPVDFMNPQVRLEKWDSIKVPANWEIEGFGTPIYVNHQYEFADFKAPVSDEIEFIDGVYPANPGKVPHDYNPVGSYRRTFQFDGDTTDLELFLHIGAMKSGGFVWLNGHFAGYSQGSKLPAEFNITKYLLKGKNTIAFQIFRWTDGSYLECQDFWRISGIERDVFIYGQPKLRIKDFEVVSTLDDSYKNGVLSLFVELENHQFKKQKGSLEFQLRDIESGNLIAETQLLEVEQKDTTEICFKTTVRNVKPWSAEHPNLYTLVLIVKDKKGNELEATSVAIGFRRVEIKQGLLLLNGQVITLKGVNTQEHNPETGHVISKDQIIQDITLWKQNNINAVRLSHYPQPEVFYELCDKYGIYVVDEANIESHGMYYGEHSLAKKPEWALPQVSRMQRMVERDRNHPSVIIWSMGNEAGNGIAFYLGYQTIKFLDKSKRPVQYERPYKDRDGNVWDMDVNTDIIVPQYPSPPFFETVGKNKPDRPFIPSEFAHAMGNSTGNFQDYWDIIEQYPHLQGGFIWDWVDQSVWKTNDKGQRFYAYGGDFGENMPTDNSFLNNGIVFPDRKPQPALHEVRKVYEYINFKNRGINKFNELRVLVENLYDFTNLNDFQFKACIKANGKVLKDIAIPEMKVETHTGKLIRLSLDSVDYKANTEYFLEIEALTTQKWGLLPKGYCVAHEQFRLNKKVWAEQQNFENGDALKIIENKDNLMLKNKQLQLVFSKTKGCISSFLFDGQELILDGQGPKPNFWRAPTDNDLGNGMERRNLEWKNASLNFSVKSLSHKKLAENEIELVIDYILPGVETSFKSRYNIFGNGVVKISNHIDTTSYKGDLPRLGMRMLMPKQFANFSYFGRGPWENYKDRNVSAFIDLYKSTVADQYVPYIRPQENGNKTNVRWALWNDDRKNGLLVVSENQQQGLSISTHHNLNEDFDITEGLDYKNKEAENVNYSKHTTDIKERDLVQINIDFDQRGVAGDDSWYSGPQEKYLIKGNREHQYTFYLIPVKGITDATVFDMNKVYGLFE